MKTGMTYEDARNIRQNTLYDSLPNSIKYEYGQMLYQNEDGIEFGFQPGIFFLVHIVTIIVALVISLIIFEKTEFK